MASAPAAVAAGDGAGAEPSVLEKMRSFDFYPKTLDDFNARMQWLRDQVQGTQSVIQNATEKYGEAVRISNEFRFGFHDF